MSLKDAKKGDVLIGLEGDEYEVKARLEDILFIRSLDIKDDLISSNTIKYLEYLDIKIKQPERLKLELGKVYEFKDGTRGLVCKRISENNILYSFEVLIFDEGKGEDNFYIDTYTQDGKNNISVENSNTDFVKLSDDQRPYYLEK